MLRGLLLWDGFGLRVLPGFVVRLIRLGLLDVALEAAFGIAARAGAGGFYAVSGAGAAGAGTGLQDGDLLRLGLQDGIVRLGRPHAHERQADAQHERGDQHAAACGSEPWMVVK